MGARTYGFTHCSSALVQIRQSKNNKSSFIHAHAVLHFITSASRLRLFFQGECTRLCDQVLVDCDVLPGLLPVAALLDATKW